MWGGSGCDRSVVCGECGRVGQVEVKSAAGVVRGNTLFKPAHVREMGALGMKVVSVVPGNAARGLPTVPGAILVLDECTGFLKGVVDGTYITALRTAAGSAAATDVLAHPRASRLVVFGAGAQAEAHVEAMAAVRNLTDITVVCSSRAKGAALLDRFSRDRPAAAGIRFNPLSTAPADEWSLQAAVRSADIVCTCTSSSVPVLPGQWLSPTAHVNAVGSYLPSVAELDTDAVRRSTIVVDTMAATEAGEIHMNVATGAISADSHVWGTLGQLLSLPPGTLFQPKLASQVRLFLVWFSKVVHVRVLCVRACARASLRVNVVCPRM